MNVKDSQEGSTLLFTTFPSACNTSNVTKRHYQLQYPRLPWSNCLSIDMALKSTKYQPGHVSCIPQGALSFIHHFRPFSAVVSLLVEVCKAKLFRVRPN